MCPFQINLRTVLSSTSCSAASTSPSSSQSWTLWASTCPPSSGCVPTGPSRKRAEPAARLQVSDAASGATVGHRFIPWFVPETEAELGVFWSELAPVLNSGSVNSRLPDVARLSYTVRTHGLEPGVRKSSVTFLLLLP